MQLLFGLSKESGDRAYLGMARVWRGLQRILREIEGGGREESSSYARPRSNLKRKTLHTEGDSASNLLNQRRKVQERDKGISLSLHTRPQPHMARGIFHGEKAERRRRRKSEIQKGSLVRAVSEPLLETLADHSKFLDRTRGEWGRREAGGKGERNSNFEPEGET